MITADMLSIRKAGAGRRQLVPRMFCALGAVEVSQ